jgi:hypothetical protein
MFSRVALEMNENFGWQKSYHFNTIEHPFRETMLSGAGVPVRSLLERKERSCN